MTSQASTLRVTSQTAGVSSDDTSASFSVSSADQGHTSGGITAYALPARQVRADSAPERGTGGLALRGRGVAHAASRPLALTADKTKARGRHGPPRVGSDDSDDEEREKSRSPTRAGEIAIRYSSPGTPRTRADTTTIRERVLSSGGQPAMHARVGTPL